MYWIALFLALAALFFLSAVVVLGRDPALRSSLFPGSHSAPNDLLGERVAEAQTRIAGAKGEHRTRSETLDQVRAELSRDTQSEEKKQRFAEAEAAVERAAKVLAFEEAQLNQLLHPTSGGLFSFGWRDLLQSPNLPYVFFGLLGIIVLFFVLNGINNPEPVGTTAQRMITFVIIVATVGIALIMVLAATVSGTESLKERFAMMREVLALLIGILGTIVGFYFGNSQTPSEAKFPEIDSVIVSDPSAGKATIQGAAHGGRGPYTWSYQFVPSSINPANFADDKAGKTEVKDHPIGNVTEFAIVATVTDAEGKKAVRVETHRVSKVEAGAAPPPPGGQK